MTASEPAVHAAYTELVLALIDARVDPFTTRFDAEVRAAVEEGRLDRETARALRWWQRESLRGVRDHLAEVLPPLLVALEAAGVRAAAAADAAHTSWQEATDEEADPTILPPTDLAERRRRTVIASLVSAASRGVEVTPVSVRGAGPR